MIHQPRRIYRNSTPPLITFMIGYCLGFASLGGLLFWLSP